MRVIPLSKVPATSRRFYDFGILSEVLGPIPEASFIFVSGSPGAGKSTLIAQALSAYTRDGKYAVYASLEEEERNIKARFDRLKLATEHIHVVDSTNIHEVLAFCEKNAIRCLFIDSIDCMHDESNAADLLQKKNVAMAIRNWTKKNKAICICISQVNKNDTLSGLKAVEHISDCNMEIDVDGENRSIQARKCRFGPAGIIHAYSMTPEGLR